MSKKYMDCFSIIAVIFILSFSLMGNPNTDSKIQEKNKLIGIPIVYYTPETKLALGGAGGYIFRFPNGTPQIRPSSLTPLVIYTLEKQFSVQLKGELYFKDNDYCLVSEFGFWKYPNKFFGIGIHSAAENEESYTSRSIIFYTTLLKQIGEGINIGFQYRFMNWNLIKVEEQGLLASGAIPGAGGGTLSGIGIIINRDTRDFIFSPLRGDFFEFNVRAYSRFFGSTYEFTQFNLDLRKYFPLFSSHVLAVQSLAIIQRGSVPFLYMTQIGGTSIMRGYFEGYFRDKNLLVFQAEYRLPLYGRFGGVVFAGVGNVAPKFAQLNLQDFKSSYGIGFRFLFDKKERIQLRLDLGWGKKSKGLYFSIFEAF